MGVFVRCLSVCPTLTRPHTGINTLPVRLSHTDPPRWWSAYIASPSVTHWPTPMGVFVHRLSVFHTLTRSNGGLRTLPLRLSHTDPPPWGSSYTDPPPAGYPSQARRSCRILAKLTHRNRGLEIGIVRTRHNAFLTSLTGYCLVAIGWDL